MRNHHGLFVPEPNVLCLSCYVPPCPSALYANGDRNKNVFKMSVYMYLFHLDCIVSYLGIAYICIILYVEGIMFPDQSISVKEFNSSGVPF